MRIGSGSFKGSRSFIDNDPTNTPMISLFWSASINALSPLAISQKRKNQGGLKIAMSYGRGCSSGQMTELCLWQIPQKMADIQILREFHETLFLLEKFFIGHKRFSAGKLFFWQKFAVTGKILQCQQIKKEFEIAERGQTMGCLCALSTGSRTYPGCRLHGPSSGTCSGRRTFSTLGAHTRGTYLRN